MGFKGSWRPGLTIRRTRRLEEHIGTLDTTTGDRWSSSWALHHDYHHGGAVPGVVVVWRCCSTTGVAVGPAITTIGTEEC